ncbi:MAG TPA: hypothetical protein VGF94_23330 [Kofleriaceae bacterium]|jgi:hypothetical protein
MGTALVVVVVIAFAYLVAKSPEQHARAVSQADGVPRTITPESRRRLARGSTAPALSSLSPAQVLVGELQTRRLGTPMPMHDDGWELMRSNDDGWE